MRTLKCGMCAFKAEQIQEFIPHYKENHPHQLSKILTPILIEDSWKYSCMNYGVVIDNFESDKL